MHNVCDCTTKPFELATSQSSNHAVSLFHAFVLELPGTLDVIDLSILCQFISVVNIFESVIGDSYLTVLCSLELFPGDHDMSIVRMARYLHKADFAFRVDA